ncbi:hypothetical protein HNR22_001793 [Micromonospora jinlongensis]|uniref:Uncharacterized protein n=1 Tax=Micromonospora jinlongensis TaxID=1287877 RepID=A0A7Y9WYU4_9ACTN|nr:hypothetical protein [Micromonospora jinlongensis]NYH42066.1 hypothetical protein [Micromonospora jinlongensis]
MRSVLGGLGFTSVLSFFGNMVGVPWGALLAVAILIIISTTVIALVQLLVPQESQHKLQMWDTVIKYRARRRTRAVATALTAPPRGVTPTPVIPRSRRSKASLQRARHHPP